MQRLVVTQPVDTLNKEPRAVLMEVKIIVVSFARKTPYLEHKVSCLILNILGVALSMTYKI